MDSDMVKEKNIIIIIFLYLKENINIEKDGMENGIMKKNIWIKKWYGFIKDYIYKYDIIFEGEYLYGEKNGKGKEYYDEGQLFYDGEYLNGEKSGKGKQYYPDGELEFEGEYLYDYKRKGKEYIKGKLIFEGEYFLYNMWTGKLYNENGNLIYQINNGNGF